MKKSNIEYIAVALSVIVVSVFVYFSYFGANLSKDNSVVQTEKSVSSGDINPLYYYSYMYEEENGQSAINCPQTKGIDWELAIYALSDYVQYEAPQADPGPAEIQRNFDENCSRNMSVYENFASKISEQ